MRTVFLVCFWLVVSFAAMMWAFHIIPNLTGRVALVPVLLAETAITLGTGFVILRCYDRHSLVRLLFVPFGMGLMAMVHGLFFFTDGSPDVGMYLGIGVAAALLLGTPLGVVLALISWIAIKRYPRASSDMPGKEGHDQKPPCKTP
jgi:hypothetical protein